MRPSASLVTALVVLLPIACTATAPADPSGRTPAAAPTITPPAAQASDPGVPPVAQADEPAAPPPAQPVDDCDLRATINTSPGPDGARTYSLTLKNEGETPRTLVTPGDGSEDGRRTPMLAWSGTRDGKPAPEVERPGCGMMNTIEASEIFTLAPGESRSMSTWLHGPSFAPGRYEVTLRYTNDPGKLDATESNPAVAAKVRASSACDVTSAPLKIEVK